MTNTIPITNFVVYANGDKNILKHVLIIKDGPTQIQ